MLASTLGGCSRSQPPAARRPVSAAVAQTSASCRECHEEIFRAWQGTDHALANRSLDPARDAAAFAAASEIADGGARFALASRDGRPTMTEKRPDGTMREHAPDFILGAKPLWQPLVATGRGRWQPTDMAFDVKRGEWFNVFGAENRQPGEWGHWTGRGMNWNSMCAPCHMTGYRKNYDPATDSYRSSWVEQGVGCIQCHGAMPDEHRFLPKNATRPAGAPKPAPFFGDRTKWMQVCATCHARGEPLTGDFQPGDLYADHYRLVLPVDPHTYYPDGQQRDEDFTWTSFRLSRMGGHGGVTCFDCHDPHTTKTLLPIDQNQLCMQCHAAPGREQSNGVRAAPIDPLAHSHHKEGSTGNSCVACHMPTTNYMQRAPRHDHGFLIPDPLLNRELGIPDACSRCHADKPVEWSIEAAEKWYGDRMDTRQRRRTRAIVAAQAGRPEAVNALLALWPKEDIAVWRATMLELLAGAANDPRVAAVAREALRDTDPLVRSAAVRVVGRSADAAAMLTPLLSDPVRSVRLDTAWALSRELPADSAARRELDAYLALGVDQPGGLALLAQDLANRGRLDEAEAKLTKAIEWDANSAGLRQTLGLVLASAGKTGEAAAQLARGADLAPNDGELAQSAALAFAEIGRMDDAERYLRLAVARAPGLHRAWYNLGLLLAQQRRAADAVAALGAAEKAAPRIADYPYALATVLLQTGDRRGAQVAAARALAIDPARDDARQLLRLAAQP